MAIAALSTAGFSQFVAASSYVSASDQAWQSLQQSVASGDLTVARSAFNTYQQLNQSASNSSGSPSSSQLSTDLQALGSAIDAGNLSTSQSALATVQNDLKSSPPQSVANAESAVGQTVQWIDDLLNLSTSSGLSNTPVDPATAMLYAAYGLNAPLNSTDPISTILSSAYSSPAAGNEASTNVDAYA